MLILGIDPGSRKSGYGLIEVHGKEIKYVASGVMKYSTKKEFLDRVDEIYLAAQELIEKFSPSEIAFEALIYVKSPTSLMKLAQSRGIILAALTRTHKKKIFEYSPTMIKSAAAGHGHADKENIQKILKLTFGIDKFETDDESDALAIALCHSQYRNKSAALPLKSRKGSLAASLGHRIGKQI